MKELSIEEKAKCYDEAIERAKEQAIDGYLDAVAVNDIFPELAESEDERIRKALMQNLKERFGTKGNMGEGLDMPEVLAWLEKQGEKESVVVIPKFRVGDVIRPKGSTAEYTIESISGECYHGKGWGFHISGDDDYELVGQKPTEWSVEDERKYNNIIALIEGKTIMRNDIKGLIRWLKSLRPRPQWKPSDEEMGAIKDAIEFLGCTKKVREDLKSLYEQLKKLREE